MCMCKWRSPEKKKAPELEKCMDQVINMRALSMHGREMAPRVVIARQPT